jgi:protein-L-isoaspartate(D-aspartate) O-methyltransferase
MVQPGGRAFGIEHVAELAAWSKAHLTTLRSTTGAVEGDEEITVFVGDGYAGLPGECTASDCLAANVEQQDFSMSSLPITYICRVGALVAQLKPGGRLVIPVGPADDGQQLLLVRKDSCGVVTAEVQCGVM